MATQVIQNLPPDFIKNLGVDLGKQITAQSGVPTVSTGLAGISQQAGESADDFAARQQAAREFTTRQQSLAGLAPQVAGQDVLQQAATRLGAESAGIDPVTGKQLEGDKGIASFRPFLDAAQTQTGEAARLAGVAESQLGTAGTTLGGIGFGPMTAQQLSTIDRDKDSATFGQTITPTLAAGSFMSPYQSQVIDATLAEFDRNKAIQEQSIRDQQASLGVLGAGRAGVQLAEFGTGAARERALLQAGLLQQGFGQAQAARQQDIANRFGLAQAQQGLGAFQTGLGSQQQAFTGRDVSQLGTLGAINQAQAQAEADASREAARQAAFLPQQQLDRYASQVTGLMGGYPGQTQQSFVPNPSPLQSALGIGTTLAGLYMSRKEGGRIGYKDGTDREGIMQMAEIDMLKDEYDQYVFDLLEQRPDATPMSFEEFRRMVLSGQG